MATWRSFEQMDAWKEGCQLVCHLYELTRTQSFSRDFVLRDQIRRSALSVPSNIAEGFERESPAAFVNFLYYAKGSCEELRTQLFIAAKLGYINRAQMRELVSQAKHLSRLLSGLIKYLKGRKQPGK